MKMKKLYPPIEPHQTGFLKVSNIHNIYWEESGNPKGMPVIFLHGGPGGGTQSWHRQFFDPTRYRIILFDQRGAGKSTPHAELRENTTLDLIDDMEKLRAQLGITQWLVFGGSWGSTLGLAYAQALPERVIGLVLRGIFLCRDQDLSWFYQSGADRIFPDYWREYRDLIPQEERFDMMSAYYRRLTNSNSDVRLAAARAWSQWEGRCLSLLPKPTVAAQFGESHLALAMARIECHYFMHQIFLRRNQLLDDAPKMAHLDGIIVHGRYDVVCPIDNAFALHAVWPRAKLKIIEDAGHAASEVGIVDALIRATDGFVH